jgi:ankyrin repeat protein
MIEEIAMATTQEPEQAIIDEFVGVSHGDFGRIKELLEQYPTLVHAQATWGETALGAAAQTGQREIAEWLIEHGAQVNLRDFNGKTPLRLAMDNNHKDVGYLLWQYGGVE